MKYINFALLVAENTFYPVSYIIKQDGTKVFKKTELKGCDLTENQIKELYYKGYFSEKPTQEEINEYLNSKKDMRGSGSKANVGRKKLGKVNLTVRVLPENIQKVKDFVTSLNK